MNEGIIFTPSASEQTFSARTVFEASKASARLTTEAHKPYARSEVLFMDRGPSAAETFQFSGEPRVEPSRSPETGPVLDPILNIRDEQARNFARAQHERIQEKPLDEWSNPELKNAYRDEIIFQRKRAKELERQGMDPETLFDDMQKHAPSVLEELRMREIHQWEDEEEGKYIADEDRIDTAKIGAEAGKILEQQGIKAEGWGPGAGRGKVAEVITPEARAKFKDSGLEDAIENADFDTIERILKDTDINNPIDPEQIRLIAEKSLVYGKEKAVYGFAVEYLLERILSTADANPDEQWPDFNYIARQNLDAIIQSARYYDDDFFKYLTELNSKRKVLHELFRNIKSRQTYTGYVTQALRKHGLDFAENDIVGVAQMQRLYEQIFAAKLADKPSGSWILESEFKEADETAKDTLTAMAKGQEGRGQEGVRKDIRNKEGKVVAHRKLREWETQRAMYVGRSLSAASQRRIVYGLYGDIPTGGDLSMSSREFEFIARGLAPLKITAKRYFGQRIAQAFLNRFITEKKSKNKYGLEMKGTQGQVGLYGKTVDSMAILDTGILDPKTHGRFLHFLYTRNQEYASVVVDGHRTTFAEHIEHVMHHAEARWLKDNNKESVHELSYQQKEAMEHKAKHDMNIELQRSGVLASQRLSLGAMIMDNSLEKESKQVLWEQTAKLLPSRIAAFLPEQTLGIVKRHAEGATDQQAQTIWRGLRQKLFIIEQARVEEDARMLRDERRDNTKKLQDYYHLQDLSDQEKSIIADLTQLGVDNAEGFSEITFPFTPFLEDAPNAAWDHLSDDDIERLIVRDQNSWEEGYDKVVGLVANPGIKSEEAEKAFVEGFHKMASPAGIHGAQGRMEPIISAWLRMAEETNTAKFFGEFLTLFRQPRSELEKFNLQDKIHMDEANIQGLLSKLAQHEVISDDPAEVNEHGRTQYQEMKEKHNATNKNLIVMYCRWVLILMGPIMGIHFIKMILPKDMQAAVGLK